MRRAQGPDDVGGKGIFPEGLGQNYLQEEYPGEIFPYNGGRPAHTGQIGVSQAPILPPGSPSLSPAASTTMAPVAVTAPVATAPTLSPTPDQSYTGQGGSPVGPGLFVAGLLALGIGIAGTVWLYHQSQAK
jgi:hypothetical protein